MHDRGTPLVHRDIKPANLLCSADLKTLKLGDFGLCRPIQTPHGGPFARAMTGVTGTMSHMAPEVLFASDGYSEKADVFSAAVCMVHLITGKQAYTAAQTQEWSPETLARRVALEGYRAPLEHRIKNKDMRDLLSSMWAHDPRERPSAAQCEVELVALLATVREKGSLSPFATLRRSFSLPTNKPELVNPLPPASSGELQARRHSLTGDLLKRVLKPFGALKMPFSSASTASSDEPHNPAARSAAHNRYGSEPPAAVRRHSEDPTASGIPILGGESLVNARVTGHADAEANCPR
ncbi:kinase-like domain-containing protein [Baffinella frigidus]|nr:kinase-like domain-containing protein [Cryptophyta sp. CCMP2293]